MSYILIKNCYDCPFRESVELEYDTCKHPKSKVNPFDMDLLYMDNQHKTHLPENCPLLEGDWTFSIDSLPIKKAFNYGETK